MTAPSSTPHIDLTDLRIDIDARVDEIGEYCASTLRMLSGDLEPVAEAMRDYCRGGKRIRALFAYCAWQAALSGRADGPSVSHEQALGAAAALELVQAAALAHDDIIDDSDTRRGRASMHVNFAQLHRASKYSGDSDAFGRSAAILVGDQLLIAADIALHRAALSDPTFAAVRLEFDAMRFEVTAGQYLDVLEQVNPSDPLESERRALRVAELKAASYTIARPMRIGAVMAGASAMTISSFATYGHHLGIAFQLRDDILGVFGDPDVTGKPAGDDLREGKRTVLLARALQRIRGSGAEAFTRVGAADLSDDEIDHIREIMRTSGAVADVEDLISEHEALARAAIEGASTTEHGGAALDLLTEAAVRRSF